MATPHPAAQEPAETNPPQAETQEQVSPQSQEQDATKKKRPSLVLKPSGIQRWRGEAGVQAAAEAINELNKFLLELDWSKLVPVEFPEVSLPTNKTFVHERARDDFGISSVPLRTRIETNLAWVALQVLSGAAEFVKSQKRNRIMVEHVQVSCNIVANLINNCEFVGAEPPPRKTKKRKATTADAAEEEADAEEADTEANAKEEEDAEASQDNAPAVSAAASINPATAAKKSAAKKGPRPAKKAKTEEA